jgi:hypothetical protein
MFSQLSVLTLLGVYVISFIDRLFVLNATEQHEQFRDRISELLEVWIH